MSAATRGDQTNLLPRKSSPRDSLSAKSRKPENKDKSFQNDFANAKVIEMMGLF